MVIVRLRKESPKKCSLTALRRRKEAGFRWIHCEAGDPIEIGEATLLHPDGELIGVEDAGRPLLLVDASWRDLPRVLRGLRGTLHRRRLPEGLRTAYPRASASFDDPASGLASIEALHAALALLGRRDDGVLQGYHWAADWLRGNSDILAAPAGPAEAAPA